MSKEKRNKTAIGEFGQTPTYKDVVDIIRRIRDMKRRNAILRRQDRIEAERTNAAIDCLFDDVRSVYPGISREELEQIILLWGIEHLQRIIDRMGEPPNRGLDF
jgi:hypothetical protein